MSVYDPNECNRVLGHFALGSRDLDRLHLVPYVCSEPDELSSRPSHHILDRLAKVLAYLFYSDRQLSEPSNGIFLVRSSFAEMRKQLRAIPENDLSHVAQRSR